VVAERSVHHQLRYFQLRPETGSHFVPVHVLVSRAGSGSRGRLRDGSLRERIFEPSILRDLPAAIWAGRHMALGLAEHLGGKPARLAFAWRRTSARGGYERPQLCVIKMSIDWTSQLRMLLMDQHEFRAEFAFCLFCPVFFA
jgi:hypothetical protein